MPEDEQEKNEATKLIELLMQGDSLSAEQAAVLEKNVSEDSFDMQSRTLLLGYYNRRKFKSPEAKKARIKHIAWFVDNRPQHEVSGSHEMMVSRGIDFLRDYIAIRRRWAAQIALHSNELNVLHNAANFFFLEEKIVAELCLVRCNELDPNNPRWLDRLSQLHHFVGATYEKLALSECERSLEMSKPAEELGILTRLPELALAADDIEKAINYSNRVLALADKSNFEYGFALQAAHTTLGRIALRSGDINKANYHLVQSLPSAEDAPDVYIGQPERQLVSELFDAGERESVLKWIDLCSRFFNVDDWRTSIAAGQSPWPYMRREKHKCFDLSRLPRSAFNKGEWENAKHAAEQFFALPTKYRDDDRNYGFGMHTSHVVLGQLALRDGDREAAKSHLREAGKVPRAERLIEEGLDMELAMDLLKLGETDVVLNFIHDCKRLWTYSKDRYLLDEWTKDVKDGKVPADWVSLYSRIVI